MIKFPIYKFGLFFRTVEESDAEFIVSLRTDPKLSRHLSHTENNLQSQKDWIARYKEREKQGEEYYFIFENESGEKLGVNRLYNFSEDSFELGSWLFKSNNNGMFPVLADIIARDFGFEKLGFSYCVFEVRKENKSVIKYHLRYNPSVTGEDELNKYFKLHHSDFKKEKDKILKVLGYGN